MVVIFGLPPGDDVDLPFVSRRFSVVLQRKRNSSFPHFPTSLAQSKNFSHNSRTLLLHTVGDCCWFNYQITWYIYIFADLFLGIFFMGKTCPIHATFHCQMRPSCQTPTQSGLQLAGRAIGIDFLFWFCASMLPLLRWGTWHDWYIVVLI